MLLLDGKKIASNTKLVLMDIVKMLHDKGAAPKLCVIQVGDDAASSVYVRNKENFCKDVGVKSETIRLDNNVTQNDLIAIIKEKNNDDSVSGILVQLPLPEHINTQNIMDTIAPEKDVDCFNSINMGQLVLGNAGYEPCTPQGIMQILDSYGISVEGKHCVVVGRSNIVGKPMAAMLTNDNATVTLCHSKTKNLKEICRQADILICAIGNPKFFNEEYVKDDVIVIDVGINRMDDGKLCGDVDFDAVKDKVYAITPVPGGVGAVTVSTLVSNVVASAINQYINKLLGVSYDSDSSRCL